MSWGKVAARGQGGKQQQSEQKSCAETGWGRRSLTLAHSVCAEEERPGKSARPGKASRVLPVRRRSRCAARPSRCAALPGAPPGVRRLSRCAVRRPSRLLPPLACALALRLLRPVCASRPPGSSRVRCPARLLVVPSPHALPVPSRPVPSPRVPPFPARLLMALLHLPQSNAGNQSARGSPSPMAPLESGTSKYSVGLDPPPMPLGRERGGFLSDLGGGSIRTYPERILTYPDVFRSFLSGYTYPDVS